MLWQFFWFGIGCCVGSFLNCVIYRLKTKKSFLKGRSFCPHCGHILAWKDLIPIFSFIFLKGRCRYCQKKISLQYPLVEFANGFLFFLLSFQNLNFFEFFISLFVFSLFLLVFVFDLKFLSIPDQILHTLLFFAFFLRVFKIFYFGYPLKETLFSLIPSFFLFLLIFFSKETWMGWGDFEISLSLGFFLDWPKILFSLFLAILSGALFGIFLIFFKKKTVKSQIPFAPFLVSGAIFSFFIDQRFFDFFFPLF